MSTKENLTMSTLVEAVVNSIKEEERTIHELGELENKLEEELATVKNDIKEQQEAMASMYKAYEALSGEPYANQPKTTAKAKSKAKPKAKAKSKAKPKADTLPKKEDAVAEMVQENREDVDGIIERNVFEDTKPDDVLETLDAPFPNLAEDVEESVGLDELDVSVVEPEVDIPESVNMSDFMADGEPVNEDLVLESGFDDDLPGEFDYGDFGW